MAILEIIGVVGVACLALAGVGLGLVFGRVQSRAWTLGYILPLIGIVAIAIVSSPRSGRRTNRRSGIGCARSEADRRSSVALAISSSS